MGRRLIVPEVRKEYGAIIGSIATFIVTITAGTTGRGAATGAVVGTRHWSPAPSGWGLAATLPAWGYNYGTSIVYANPYYVAEATPAYDYSQPIVINTYNMPTSDASADASPEQTTTATKESPQVTQGYQLFDSARESFSQGDYSQALSLTEQAIKSVANDPVLHEFGALCLFARGDYSRAAAVLNAVLAAAPGTGLDDYEQSVSERRYLHPTAAKAGGLHQREAE